MNTSKKTAFGILGVAASAALIAGATAAPALADDYDGSTTNSWSEYTTTLTGALTGGDLGFSNASPIVVAPEVSTGDILGGDILSGNETGNGNVVGSGNDTAVGSGNTTGIDGVDIDASDLFDSTVGDLTGDITAHVSGILDSVDVTLDTLFQD